MRFGLGLIAALTATGGVVASGVVTGRTNDSQDLAGQAAAGIPEAGRAGARPLRLRPVGETEPVPHGGDAADDPAIWVHPRDPARSTIIGTDKDGGLAVYDLSGRELQYLPDGRLNNVDLRAGFGLQGRRVTLVAASNRADDTVALYRIDERSRRLAPVDSFKAGISVYGLCMYRNGRGEYYVFVDSADNQGEVEQWRLVPAGGGVRARRVRSFDVGSAVEGCVADDELGHLYIGEEDRGIWKYGAEPATGLKRTLVDSTGDSGHLAADVEGLTIAHGPRGTGLLLASSQGDDSFAIYRREGANRFVGRFRIAGASGVDGVEETDGIDVTTAALGPRFPGGLFVAQDHDNSGDNQNFKLLRWRTPR